MGRRVGENFGGVVGEGGGWGQKNRIISIYGEVGKKPARNTTA